MAIDRCQQINLPLTLAMTATPANLAHLWETITSGLGIPHMRHTPRILGPWTGYQCLAAGIIVSGSCGSSSGD